MKKIINNAPSLAIATQRTPLTVTLSVVAAQGALTQAQDEGKTLWQPDRRITPLILAPLFSAYDPDQGRELSVTPEVAWYKNAIGDHDAATGDGRITSYTVSDDYYLETNATSAAATGRLVVRANTDYRTPVTLICVATYTDNTRSQTYTEERRVLLTAENRPDEFYMVAIQAPQQVAFHPLRDTTSRKTIAAFAQYGPTPLRWDAVVGRAVGAVDLGTLDWSLAAGVFTATLPTLAKTTGGAAAPGYTQDSALGSDKTLSVSSGAIAMRDAAHSTASAFASAMRGTILFYELATKTADMDFDDAMQLLTLFFWYADGVLIATDGSFPGYVGGQGSERITLDMDYIDGVALSVRIGVPTFADGADGLTRTVVLPTAPNAPATDSVLLAWKWGHIDALPIANGGSKMREKSGDKTFVAVVREDGVDVADAKADEYLRLNWKSHATNANYATLNDHGWGREATVAASRLKQTGGTDVEVTADIYTLGPLEIVTDDTGAAVTDDDGEYVVGRS